MRIGSLCSGYEGIALGLELLFPVQHVFFADPNSAASAILAHHWPHVPNLGDLTSVDWATQAAIDLLTAGYPCQPFSLAGKRRGADDERHLWPHIAVAIGVLRPRRVFLENVAGHVSLGLGVVLGDLAALGYDATWGVVRASDAGAPHRRERLFILAADAGSSGQQRPLLQVRGTRSGDVPARSGAASAADANGLGRARARRGGGAAGERRTPDRRALTDSDSHGQPRLGRVDDGERDADRRGRADIAWGAYESAVRRWEHVTGCRAPAPTESGRHGKPRLSAVFVEWLMGLPAGHVTAVPGLNRAAQLKALGNGVVPQQCALALQVLSGLLDRHPVTSQPRKATA